MGGTYDFRRELGARSIRSYAAIREPQELVVAVRFARAAAEGVTVVDDETMATLARDARCLHANFHPNIARIRHVDVDDGKLTIASELLDGTTLADLLVAAEEARSPDAPPDEPLLAPELVVRIVVDVLAGLAAFHALRDGSRALGAIHGELCPANLVIGKDGVARIVNVIRPRTRNVRASTEGVAYAAHEAFDARVKLDVRADIHAVGVILWELLTGKRLYEETDPARILARQRTETVASPALDPASPFAPLADITMQALAFDPAMRFRTATQMAGELRRALGPNIASGRAVAARVATLCGAKIRARRATLDPSLSAARRKMELADEIELAAEPGDRTTPTPGSLPNASTLVVPTTSAPPAVITAKPPPAVVTAKPPPAVVTAKPPPAVAAKPASAPAVVAAKPASPGPTKVSRVATKVSAPAIPAPKPAPAPSVTKPLAKPVPKPAPPPKATPATMPVAIAEEEAIAVFEDDSVAAPPPVVPSSPAIVAAPPAPSSPALVAAPPPPPPPPEPPSLVVDVSADGRVITPTSNEALSAFADATGEPAPVAPRRRRGAMVVLLGLALLSISIVVFATRGRDAEPKKTVLATPVTSVTARVTGATPAPSPPPAATAAAPQDAATAETTEATASDDAATRPTDTATPAGSGTQPSFAPKKPTYDPLGI